MPIFTSALHILQAGLPRASSSLPPSIMHSFCTRGDGDGEEDHGPLIPLSTGSALHSFPCLLVLPCVDCLSLPPSDSPLLLKQNRALPAPSLLKHSRIPAPVTLVHVHT